MKVSGTVATDLAKGAAAGAAAVWVMDRVDWFMVDHEDPEAWRKTQSVRPNGEDPAHNMVGMAARAVGAEPPPQPHPAGVAMHYAVGMAPTAIYGVARRHLPGGIVGRGLMLGLGLFLVEDEIINSLTGAAAPPQHYPWQAHARSLVSHLVLGLVTETILSALDRPRGNGASEGTPSPRQRTRRARDFMDEEQQSPGSPQVDMYGIRFSLEDSGRMVEVTVPYEALHKAEGIYSGGPMDQDYLEAFQRHRWVLEEAARHKIHDGKFEQDGTVRVVTDDLSVLDAAT